MKDLKLKLLESLNISESKIDLNDFIKELIPMLDDKGWVDLTNIHKHITGWEFWNASGELEDLLSPGVKDDLSRYLGCNENDLDKFIEDNFDNICDELDKAAEEHK